MMLIEEINEEIDTTQIPLKESKNNLHQVSLIDSQQSSQYLEQEVRTQFERFPEISFLII